MANARHPTMRTDFAPESVDAEPPRFRKLTLDLYDNLAPGILAFLRGLPPRAETAFIRAVIYQWMLDHQGLEDYEERLLDVLNGPGGRPVFAIHGATSQSAPALKPALRKAPRKQTQAIKPLAISRRHQLSDSVSANGTDSMIPGGSDLTVDSSALRRPTGSGRVQIPFQTCLPPTIGPAPVALSPSEFSSEVGFLDDLLG